MGSILIADPEGKPIPPGQSFSGLFFQDFVQCIRTMVASHWFVSHLPEPKQEHDETEEMFVKRQEEHEKVYICFISFLCL